MATSAPLSSRPTEENNPGQDRIEYLTEREFNPQDYERRHGGAADDPSDPRGDPNEDYSEDEPAGDPSDPRGDNLNPEELSAVEESSAQGQVSQEYEQKLGKGYNKHPDKKGFIRSRLGRRNRIFLVAGSGVTVIAILGIILFLVIAPFKILNIVNNLQSRFYATSENAVQNETDLLFTDYIKRYVLPALKNCPASVTRACNPINQGGLVSQLYKGWRHAKLEDTLASKYGIEFKYGEGLLGSHHFYIKTKDSTGNGIDLGSDTDPKSFLNSSEPLGKFIDTSNDPQFRIVSRSELRQAYRTSLSSETRWKQVMYRFKVGGLLNRKYGLKRCIIACNTRDNFADWKENKVRAAKIILAQRILEPRSDMLAIVLQCIFDGGCDVQTTDSEGRLTTAFDSRVQTKLDEYAALYGTESVAKMVETANQIGDKGFQKYLTDKIVGTLVGKFGGDVATQEAASDVADKALPVVGWVNTAAKVLSVASSANTDIKHFSYVVNAAGMVGTWGVYRTYADEAKTGHIDSSIFGSFSSALGKGDIDSAGGTAEAEQAPYYGNLFGGVKDPTSKTYKCQGGTTVPQGKLVCPEEALSATNSTLASISDGVNKSGITTVVNAWNDSFGRLFGYASSTIGKVTDTVLSKLPGFSQLQDAISNAAAPLIKLIINYIVPTPFSDNMAGGRTFDMMAGGADISGNDFAHNGLGGQEITPTQLSSILGAQNQQQLEDYQGKPLLSRLFGTSSRYSPATKLAMALPASSGDLQSQLSGILVHPLRLFQNVGSIFSGNVIAAAPEEDPFGITQYGYLIDDPRLSSANQDPSAYWLENCTTDGTNIDWAEPINDSWQKGAVINPDTGMPENTTTDPCLLIQAAAGSAGAIYDSSLLTSDDVSSQSAVDSTSSATGGSLPSGSAQQLASQLMGYVNNGKIQCASSGCPDIANTASGQSIRSGSCQVSGLQPGLLGMLLELAQMGHTFTLSALCSDHPTIDGPSGHNGGRAADFSTIDGVVMGPDKDTPWTKTKIDAADKLDRDIASFMPKSTGFGQVGPNADGVTCHPSFDFLSGFDTFGDDCHHQHVQVEV